MREKENKGREESGEMNSSDEENGYVMVLLKK
jgi:hypothetical protein